MTKQNSRYLAWGIDPITKEYKSISGASEEEVKGSGLTNIVGQYGSWPTKPTAPPVSTPTQPTQPITTSTPAKSELSDIDTQIAKLGLEMPSEVESTKEQDILTKQSQLLQENYNQRANQIAQQTKERVAGQEQTGKAITSQSRVALAGLGILSTEPELVSATSSTQYLNDIQTNNQKEIDGIKSEEQTLLTAAANARDAGQYDLAMKQVENAKALRQERNNLLLQVAQEVRATKQAEKEMSAQDFSQWLNTKQEERAQETFDYNKAKSALDYISWDNFDEYTPTDITKLEQATGLPEGALSKIAKDKTMMSAIEGWQSQVYNDQNTGEVKVLYTRINPTNGEPEFKTVNAGKIGDRYQIKIPSISNGNTIPETITPTGEINTQLYAGLSSQTSTAVRTKVSGFKSEPIVTNFNVINEGYNFAKSITSDTKNPADDIGMIYAFAKIMDPNSVVREGEYATVQKYAQTWAESFGFKASRIFSNTKFLTKEALENMKKTLELKYNASKSNYNNIYQQYSQGINNLTGRNDGNKFLVDYSQAFNEQQKTEEPKKEQIQKGDEIWEDDGTGNFIRIK
ncbi:MAG: hypothetical protein WC549_04680 [Actinomycetota bacterium]